MGCNTVVSHLEKMMYKKVESGVDINIVISGFKEAGFEVKDRKVFNENKEFVQLTAYLARTTKKKENSNK